MSCPTSTCETFSNEQFETIRAILGVSDDEVSDEVLNLPIYNLQAQEALTDVSETLQGSVQAAKGLTPPTPKSTRLVKLAETYQAYATAKMLLTALPMFAPKRITDGRAEQERVQDPFKDVKEGLGAALIDLRYKTKQAEAVFNAEQSGTTAPAATRTFYTLVSSAGLATDPVTNL